MYFIAGTFGSEPSILKRPEGHSSFKRPEMRAGCSKADQASDPGPVPVWRHNPMLQRNSPTELSVFQERVKRPIHQDEVVRYRGRWEHESSSGVTLLGLAAERILGRGQIYNLDNDRLVISVPEVKRERVAWWNRWIGGGWICQNKTSVREPSTCIVQEFESGDYPQASVEFWLESLE
jgi:hypothetical protein